MKRKNMMLRNMQQTIIKSMGRYIAIVAIIALGAGLFCGLRVTKVDMVETVQRYTDHRNMFDVRVQNTYGWTDVDVAALTQVEGVAEAEGAISMDVLARTERGEDDLAYRFLSIPKAVNLVSLDAGRMPSSPDECLLDSFYAGESMIGQTITISKNNEESTLENLACESYTVVGLCSTPLYLNMQRGSTSIGDGSLDGFLYIPIDGFALDIYTEINLTLENRHSVYTDNYDDAMDGLAERVEEACQPLIQRRYEEVLAEAKEAYADGLQEYLDGSAEFREGRNEALAELRDAEQQILDAETELASNRALIEDGLLQIEEGRKLLDEGLATLAESRVTLAQTRADTYAQIADTYNTLMTNYSEALAGQRDVESGLAQIESGITQLQFGIAQIDISIAAIEVLIPVMDTSITTAQSALDAAKAQEGSDKETIDDLEAQLKELGEKKDAYESQLAELKTTRTECETQLADLKTKQTELLETQKTLEAAVEQIELGFTQIEQARIDADNQLTAAQAQLEAAEAQAQFNQQQMDAQQAELEAGLAELESAEAEVADARAEFESEKAKALRELDDAMAELTDARMQLNDARDAINEMGPADVYALTRNTNHGYVVFENDASIVAGVAEIFPAFFLAVAALVCITTMTRMVDEERTQIGILKALGYSRGAVMFKYLGYSGSGALLGCFTGVMLGSIIFPHILWNAYCIMYCIPEPLVLCFDWGTIASIVLSYTALTLLVTWNCCRRELRNVPAELIRPKAPAAGKKVFLERLPIWQKLKFLDKVAIRNIFRYRQRFAMMMLGIGGCTALLVTGFGIKDSIMDIVEYQYDSVQVYDIGVSFDGTQSEAAQSEFRTEFRGRAEQVLFCYQGSIDVEYDGVTKDINFLATDRDLSGFFDLHCGDEKISMPGKNEAILSIGTANALGVEVGDTLTLRSGSEGEMTVTLSGIFDNYVWNYVIIHGSTMEAQWGHDPELSTAYVVSAPEEDVRALGADLAGYEGVTYVNVNLDTREAVGNMLKALDSIVLVIVLCAGLLAGIVLYNLTNINIRERIREIATIKVLGFRAGETASYVFKENLALTIIGTLVGLVGGKFLHALVMSYVRIDMVWFDNRILWYSYIFSAVLTILSAVIVDFVMYFQLDKINMAEALKSVE